jgi:hypothetical protein
MKNMKKIAFSEITIMILAMFAFSFLMAVPEVSATTSLSESTFCCEKTTDGANCINTQEANCNTGFASAPTSCGSTSFCNTGTCYNPVEGNCIQNTPKATCENDGGVWSEEDINSVAQCQLGCCVISDQAAFVSKTRCSRLSSFVGVTADYFTDVEDEFSCILLAKGSQMGACVFEQGPDLTCQFTSRNECSGEESFLGINQTSGSGKKFYADVLCSAAELGTNCEKQYKTKCDGGKVYWEDSCGNKENVYSSNSAASYNNGRVAEDDDVCNPVAGSTSCGNCDYLSGGICAEKDNNFGEAGVNNFCQATTCNDRSGNNRKNGESWCVYDGKIGSGADTVGSRHFREICLNGEVIAEGCADYRNEICIHDELTNGFDVAACRVNLWQSCTSQEKQSDCLNRDVRDCTWYEEVEGVDLSGGSSASQGSGYSSTSSGFSIYDMSLTGNAIVGSGTGTGELNVPLVVVDTTIGVNESTNGTCVPRFPPGLQFWNSGSATSHCAKASATCTVTYEETLDWDFSKDKKIISGAECLDPEWGEKVNQVCVAMGDCGGYINFKGKYTQDGYKWIGLNGSEIRFNAISINKINIMSTGNFLKMVGNAIFGFVSARPRPGTSANSDAGEIQQLGNNLQALERTTNQAGNLVFGDAFYTGDTRAYLRALENHKKARNTRLSIEAIIESRLETGQILHEWEGEYWIKDNGVKVETPDELGPLFNDANEKLRIDQTKLREANTAYAKIGTMDRLGNAFGGVLDAAKQGIVMAGLINQMAEIFKTPDARKDALFNAAFYGFFTAKSISRVFGRTGLNVLGDNAGWVGAVAGIGVAYWQYIDSYSDITTEEVKFECKPWQAPLGQNECAACSANDLPCSEYRCRALGPTCGIVNQGTDSVECIDMSLNDARGPTITPDTTALTSGYIYSEVSDEGFKIEKEGGGCLPAFSSIQWGIQTDEPAQCKIELRHTQTFDEMRFYFGGENLYSEEHEEFVVVPNSVDLANLSAGGITVENGNEMEVYIRCRDGNENANGGQGNVGAAEYAVGFCVDDTPDKTPPQVVSASVSSGSCVAANTTTAPVTFYTNEPATCRWDKQDRTEFNDLQYSMSCSRNALETSALTVYPCTAQLTEINSLDTPFYIKCKDSDGNENGASYDFSLRGSMPLKMMDIEPNSTDIIRSGSSPAEVNLYVETMFGCDTALCFYSETGSPSDFTLMVDTGNEDGVHTQKLFFEDGLQTMHFQCVDSGGNTAQNSTTFDVDINTEAPKIVRAYESGNLLKVVTSKDATCAYTHDSCDFLVAEGSQMTSSSSNQKEHMAEWLKDTTYYIKCKDDFNNEDIGCSLIVRPVENFL